MALTLHQSGHGHSHGGLSSHGHSHEKERGKGHAQISNHAHFVDNLADVEQNRDDQGMFIHTRFGCGRSYGLFILLSGGKKHVCSHHKITNVLCY